MYLPSASDVKGERLPCPFDGFLEGWRAGDDAGEIRQRDAEVGSGILVHDRDVVLAHLWTRGPVAVVVARSAVAAALGTAAALALSSPLPFHPRAILLRRRRHAARRSAPR
jgi:hypothetical protein